MQFLAKKKFLRYTQSICKLGYLREKKTQITDAATCQVWLKAEKYQEEAANPPKNIKLKKG